MKCLEKCMAGRIRVEEARGHTRSTMTQKDQSLCRSVDRSLVL